MSPLPILLSIPHGGTVIPPEVTEFTSLTPADVFYDGDACTIDIYDVGEAIARVVKSTIARAVVDMNRAPDDRPPENSDGVVKTTTCQGVPVYRLSGTALDDDFARVLVDRHHRPYHEKLQRAGEDPAIALALDCHSMAEVAPRTAPDAGRKRPTFCLSNRYGQTCSDALLVETGKAMAAAFEVPDSEISYNEPFTGGYISSRHGADGVPWIQVEMNRSLYLAEPWFDRDRLDVDAERLDDLNRRFLAALAELEF